MMLTKETAYRAATLLPLYNGAIMKKEDIMDTAEKKYLNTQHPDFTNTISSGNVTSGRKSEEWAIQKSYEEGLIDRIKTGYYKITEKGKEWLEHLAGQIEVADQYSTLDNSNTPNLLTDQFFNEMLKIYQKNANKIADRQAAEVRKQIAANQGMSTNPTPTTSQQTP